jgi:hypothetical protein
VEGWLEQSFSWNPNDPQGGFNGPVVPNDQANEYQLNQLAFVARRPLDEASSGPDFGYCFEFLYGTDAIFFQAEGLDRGLLSDASHPFSQLAFPRMYVETKLSQWERLTFRVGHWISAVGYEARQRPTDFFLSETLGANPLAATITGARVECAFSDRLSGSLALHQGADIFLAERFVPGGSGRLVWGGRDEPTSIIFAFLAGQNQSSTGTADPRLFQSSLTLIHHLNPRLRYVVNNDFFVQRDGSRQGEGAGVSQFLIWDYNDRLSLGARLEVYRDQDQFGLVGSGPRSMNPVTPSWFTNLTVAANWNPWPNVLVRPELRTDWQNRDDPTAPAAFDGGQETQQFLAALSVALHF